MRNFSYNLCPSKIARQAALKEKLPIVALTAPGGLSSFVEREPVVLF